MATSDTNHGNLLLQLLLQICEDFFANAGPATHHEVDILLRTHGVTGGRGWLIDMLGLTRLRLQNPTPTTSRAPTTTSDLCKISRTQLCTPTSTPTAPTMASCR